MRAVLLNIVLFALVLSVTGTTGPSGFPMQETLLQSAQPMANNLLNLEQISMRLAIATFTGGAGPFWVLLTVGMLMLGTILRLTRMLLKTKL